MNIGNREIGVEGREDGRREMGRKEERRRRVREGEGGGSNKKNKGVGKWIRA